METNKDTLLNDKPIMMTLKEASEYTGMSYDALRKLCLQNKLVHIRVGKKFLINRFKLEDYLNTGDYNGPAGSTNGGIKYEA